jgi:hypothetical protein
MFVQSSWSKGISETNLKLYIPYSKCMHQPVTSHANACNSQAYASMYCMHCPMTSQADACSYCMGSVALILSRIYLYLYLLCVCYCLLWCQLPSESVKLTQLHQNESELAWPGFVVFIKNSNQFFMYWDILYWILNVFFFTIKFCPFTYEINKNELIQMPILDISNFK